MTAGHDDSGDNDGSYLDRLQDDLRLLGELKRERRFDEVARLLDKMHGIGTSARHAAECELIWERGDKPDALNKVIARLRGGDYSLSHVFQGAIYAYILNDIEVSKYLYEVFESKFSETSSLNLIEFVFRRLHNLSVSRDIESEASLFIPRR